MNQLTHSTTLNHLRNLKELLISIPFGFTTCMIFYLITRDKNLFFFFGIGYLIYMIPVILIHANYYYYDKRKRIVTDGLKKSMEVIDNGRRLMVFLPDIESVEFTTGLEGRAGSIWSNYYYYQIQLKNGELIFLTSLLIKKNELPFEVNFKRNSAFPFVKHSKPTVEN